MSMVPVNDQKRIDQALEARDVTTALDVLAKHPDLRHTDLPGCSKAALEGIGKDPAAVKALALGAASAALSVRRFSRKYLPKLGEAAASPLLALALETVVPVQASPVAKLGRELAREVMEGLTYLVGAASSDALLRLYEYSEAFTKAHDGKKTDALVLADVVANEGSQHLRKDEEAYGDAVLRWAEGTLTLDLPTDDPARKAVTERFLALGEKATSDYREHVMWKRARFAGVASREKRQALWAILRRRQEKVEPKHRALVERALDELRSRAAAEAAEYEAAWQRSR